MTRKKSAGRSEDLFGEAKPALEKKTRVGVSTAKEMVQLLEEARQRPIVSPKLPNHRHPKRQQFKDAIGRRLNDNLMVQQLLARPRRPHVALVTTPKGKLAIAITVDGLKTIDYSEDNPGLLLIARLTPLLIQGLAAA